MPLIIGITGSIATGKSTACRRMMSEMGAHHCDADRLVHRLYDPGTGAFDRIVAIFGAEIVGEDGFIDRRKLGAKVFGKPEEMGKLTGGYRKHRGRRQTGHRRLERDARPNDVALLEAVNLIEAGYGRWCSQVWLVACEEETARARLAARNSFTPEEVEQRLASQRPWEDRSPAADLVIFNNGTEAEFESEVRSRFSDVRNLWQTGEIEPSRYAAWWAEKASPE